MERFVFNAARNAWEDTEAVPGMVRFFREVKFINDGGSQVIAGKLYPVGGFTYFPGKDGTQARVLIGTIYEDGTMPEHGIDVRRMIPEPLAPWPANPDAEEKQKLLDYLPKAYAAQYDEMHDAAQKLLAVNGKSTNPKEAIGSTKIPFHMIPAGPLAWMAMAFYEGGTKYGPYNWRVAGVRASTYVSAVMRHLEKWWNGHDTDPATKVHHLANAMAGLAIILDAEIQGMLTDDRPPKQDLEALFAKLSEVQAHLTELNKAANPPNYTEAEHGKKENA